MARARRAARANENSALGAALHTLAGQLEDDAASLERVIHELSLRENRWKRAVAMFGERIGRLKPNGHVVRASPLTPVLEIELLMAGIDAKRSLWRSLQAAYGTQLRSVDLDDLVTRAGDQRAMLRPHHRSAAQDAFADP